MGIFDGIVRFAITATPKVISSVGTFLKSPVGKVTAVAAASVPVTYAVGKSISNITTPLGLNENANISKEIEKLEATNKVLESSTKANTNAIEQASSASKSGTASSSVSNFNSLILTGLLVIVAGAGIYYIGKNK